MSISRLLSLPLALALTIAVPATSFADDGYENFGRRAAAGQQGRSKTAGRIRQHVEKRLARLQQHLERMLEQQGVSPEARNALRDRFAQGANRLRAAAERIAADGRVTQQERQALKQLTKQLKQRMRGGKGTRSRQGRGGRGGPQGMRGGDPRMGQPEMEQPDMRQGGHGEEPEVDAEDDRGPMAM